MGDAILAVVRRRSAALVARDAAGNASKPVALTLRVR